LFAIFKPPAKVGAMKILIDLPKSIGAKLDSLAKQENRSRTAQARHIVVEHLGRSVSHTDAKKKEAGV
jgi:predicted transcriptional regulator